MKAKIQAIIPGIEVYNINACQSPESNPSKVKKPTKSPNNYPTLIDNYIRLMYLPLTLLGVVSVIKVIASGPINPTSNPSNPLIIMSTIILGENAVMTITMQVNPEE